MKLKKLLSLALLALIACSAWAQGTSTKPVPTFSALADDGATIQYLYNVDAKAFVLGANDWGTRASVSTNDGYMFKVQNNGNGTWTLNNYVESKSAWLAVFASGQNDIWVDNLNGANVNGWVIALNDDGITYSITNPGAGEGKLAASGFPDDTRLYLSNDGKYDKWAFVNSDVFALERQSNRPCKDWALVKNVDAFNATSNFFALYEKNTGLVLSTKEGKEQSGFKTMTLKEDADPTKDKSSLWIVTDNGGNHNITNAEWREFYFQTEWGASWYWRCSDNGAGAAEWGYVNFKSYPDLTWKIEQNQNGDNYLGPWNGAIVANDEFAGNKSEAAAPAFDIYAISKGKYVAEYEDIANATVSNPIDLNYLIVNASGSYRNMIGWIHNNSFQTQNNNGLANNVGENGRFFEAWQSSGNLSDRKMYQKLTDLPAGKYQISVLTDCEASGAFVYGNINKAELNTKVDGKASVVADVIDGTLEFGVELDGYQSNWVKFDNFELKYLGFDLTEVLNALKAQIDAATFTEKHSAASEAALQTAIAAAQALVDAGTGTIAEIEESAGNLSSAVAAVNASIADYDNLKSAIDNVSYQVVDPNYTALATAITTAQTIYDEAATESCEATIAALDAAVKAAKVNDYNYVITYFTEDASLGNWNNTYDTNKKTNEGYDSSTGYYDLWSGNAAPAISQTVTLPAGEYALIGIGRGQEGQSTEKLSVKIGDGEAITVDFLMKGNTGLGVNTSGQADFTVGEGHEYTRNGEGQGWEYRFILFTLTEESSVTLGTNATLSNSWAGVYPLQVKTTPESIKALKIIEINTLAATAPESKMQASVKATLDEKLAAAEAATTGYTKEQLQTVYDELKEAIDEAIASVETYENCKTYNEKAANLDADGQAAYASTLQAYTDGLLTDASEAEAAYLAAVRAQTTEGADMTDAIVNPNFDGNINGWTDTYTSGNHGFQGGYYQNGDVVIDKFMECWVASDGSLSNGSLYQVITGLPEGEYTMSADIIACRQYQTIEQKGVYIFAQSDVLFKSEDCSTENEKPQTYSFDFKMTGETLSLGLMTENTNCNWVAFDNVRLTYNGPLKSNIYQDQLVEALKGYAEAITDEDLSDEVKGAYAATYASVLEASQTDGQSDEYYINALESLENAYAAVEQARQAALIARTAAEAGTSPYTGSVATAGTFYLYNVQAGKFMQGANDWGTRISLCEAGQPMILAGSNGVYTIDSQISNGGNNHYVGTGGYLDGGASEFKFIPANVDNMYIISFGENNYAYDGNSSLVATQSNLTPGSFWQLVSAADIKAAAVANASEENPFDVSSLVLDQNFGRNNTLNSAWSHSNNGGDFQISKGNNSNNNMQQWSGTFTMAQTISDIPNGLYKVTFQGFYRDGSNDNAAQAHSEGTEVLRSFVDANGTSVAVKSVMSEAQTASGNGFDKETSCGYVPNSQSNAGDAFTAGYYQNDPIEVLVFDGKLTITAYCKENVNDSWTVLDNFKLYYLCPLEDAIDRMVPQIVNGDFEADYSVVSGTGVSSDRAIYQPNGWTVSYKGDTNDMTILNSGDLAASNFTSITALDNGGNNTYLYRGKWGNNTNIEVSQYVALPAGTYTFTCDAWKSGLGGNGTIFVGNQNATLDANATEWKPLSLEFTVTDEYEIVKLGFNIIHNSDGSEKFIGFDNFTLSNASATMSIGTAHFGTFIAPFDVTLPEGVEAYGCSSVNGEVLELTSMNGTIPANTPAIVYSENTVNQTFYGISTAEKDEYTVDYLTGVYTAKEAPVGSYVLQNHDGAIKFYVVDSETQPTVKANRCYLTVAGTEIKAFGFNFADAIKNINVNKNSNETIYNLAGQAVDNNYKGIVIKNGKKVLVK